MSAVTSLIRLHRWQLNDRRRRVVELEALLEQRCADLDALECELAKEGEAAGRSLPGALAYPAYAAVTLKRRGALQNSIAELSGALDQAREEIMEAYRDLKKHEQLQRNQLERERVKAAKRAQNLDDEQTIARYRHGAAAGVGEGV